MLDVGCDQAGWELVHLRGLCFCLPCADVGVFAWLHCNMDMDCGIMGFLLSEATLDTQDMIRMLALACLTVTGSYKKR